MHLELDLKLNPWIGNLQSDIDINQHLNKLLNIGYNVMSQITLTQNSEQTNKFIELYSKHNEQAIDNLCSHVVQNTSSINERISEIERKTSKTIDTNHEKMIELVEKMTGKMKTSASRGDIGENFIQEGLEIYFPNDEVIRTSGAAHESDIQLISEDSANIIIESKNYTSVVQTKEIEKFKKDMIRTNMPFGIFISFSSKVIGKKNMEIEQFNDNMCILYLIDIGFSIDLIVLGINVMKRISKLICNSKSVIPRSVLNDKINSVVEIISKLPEILSLMSKAKATLLIEQANIKKSLDTIHSEYITTEAYIKNLIDKVQEEIDYTLSFFQEIDKETREDIEELLEIVDDKKKDHLRIILTQLLIHNLSIESEGNGYNIRRANGKEIISKLTGRGKIKLNIISKNIEFDLSKKDLSSLDTYFAIIEKI